MSVHTRIMVSLVAVVMCFGRVSAAGTIVTAVVTVENEDPFQAGKVAAGQLLAKMGGIAPRLVLVAECFEEEALKTKVLEGVCAVLPKKVVFGGATYGSFEQGGCHDLDAVTLLGIGGAGISVKAVLQENLGVAGLTMEKDETQIASRLREAGSRAVSRLSRTPKDRLLLLIPDAHSPKNAFLVEGAQKVLGVKFPITGGSVNKNAGQTFVYYEGAMYRDSAVALMLSGDFKVALSGRQAKDNDSVIATAREGAAEALTSLGTQPFAVLAFNCAGRMGKLDDIEDELRAMQSVIGKKVPLFGCYCAGEIGPGQTGAEKPGVLSEGVGWHVMFTFFGKE